MDKGIGFSRTIELDWLDATASLCLDKVDITEMRKRLVPIIQDKVHGVEAQRKTIDVLTAIWARSEKSVPRLRQQALEIYPTLSIREDRVWLHYGMTLVCYQIFRRCTAVIGQVSRSEDTITRKIIKERITAEIGHLGALDRSIERIIASLTEWGILSHGIERNIYKIHMRVIQASSINLQTWLLACALRSHPSDAVPFADLVALPELFPFRFTSTINDLMRDDRFKIDRQGGGLEMVEGSKNI